jgi:hypothetical protein
VERPPRALSPLEALRAALGLIGASKGAAFALGFSLYASLVAVCCGLGVFAAPFFLCELWALLLANGTGLEIPRSRAWIAAGLIQTLAVLVTWSVLLVALCVLRPELLTGGSVDLSGDRVAILLQALVAMNVAGALVIGVSVHAQYAPAILLERGGSVVGAVLESARLVHDSSALRTFITSGLAHALQAGVPLVGTTLLTTLASSWSMALYGMLLLPVSVGALLVGQGMVVASYLHVRPKVTEHDLSALCRTSSGLLVGLSLLLGTLAGPVAVSFAALKPAEAEPGAALMPDDVLLRLGPSEALTERFIEHTALSVRLDHGRVTVMAGDGGGAGHIPTGAPVRQVRVGRARPVQRRADAELSFAVELRLEDGRVLVTQIDEAGVRRDDSIERRVASRLRVVPALMLLLALVWAATWVARMLPEQARLLQRYEREKSADPNLDLRVLRFRSFTLALWLAPATAASWWVATSVLAR